LLRDVCVRTVESSRGIEVEEAREPQVLVLDSSATETWRRLFPAQHTTSLGEHDRLIPLDPLGGKGVGDPERVFEVARRHAGRFDFIVGECTSALLWQAVFRLIGDETPFVIMPRYNHVFLPHAYALLLSSQLCGPRDILLTGSEAARRSFSAYGFAADALFVPGVSLETFRPLGASKEELRRALGLAGDVPLLLYAGRVADDKSVVELIEAVGRVRGSRPVQLAICYHAQREAYLERCRERAGMTGGACFVGAPATAELARWYNAADLYVTAATSVFETFGRAPVEAMACGTPPVLPAYDGFRETVPPEIGLLVPTVRGEVRHTVNVDELGDAILAALEDVEGLVERARAAVVHAGAFSEPRTAAALRQRLGAVTGAASGRRDRRRFALEDYPAATREMWGALEGRSVEELLRSFLAAPVVPIRPSAAARRGCHWSWFDHY
jgi:glycosyltransferase involved in cell wall biosynthesis